jgi:hypothetical protein
VLLLNRFGLLIGSVVANIRLGSAVEIRVLAALLTASNLEGGPSRTAPQLGGMTRSYGKRKAPSDCSIGRVSEKRHEVQCKAPTLQGPCDRLSVSHWRELARNLKT